MTRPDLKVYAALVLAGGLSVDQAQTIVDTYGEQPGYDNPIPINVDSAIHILVDALSAKDDDDVVDEILHPSEAIPEEVVEPTGNGMTEDDVHGAMALWHGVRQVIQSMVRE